MELDIGLAMGAAGQAGTQQSPGFVAVDGAVVFARGVAVAGVDLDRRVPLTGAEFDDPLWRGGPAAATLFLLTFTLPENCDLAVDALDPQGMPDPHSVESALSSVLSSTGLRL